jgi:Fe-S cluster biogenesis protein NfuA
MNARERAARVEELLASLDTLPDPVARTRAGEALTALVDLYGDVLSRIMAAVAESSDRELAAALAGDDLVCHLLLVHDLHPLGVEERIVRALDGLPSSALPGATVRFDGVESGVARVAVVGGGAACGCGSPPGGVEQLIETVVWDSAPELDGVRVERRPEPVPVSLRPAGRASPAKVAS